MTKLYHNGELEGWQVPGQQAPKARRVDVPNSPAELANWLNSRRVPVDGDVFDGLVPGNAAASELLAEIRGSWDAKPWVVGPITRDPPRFSPAFLGDVEAQASFIPVTKAAEIDRLLERCPMCHNTAAAAELRRDRLDFDGIMAWIKERATGLELDDLHDLIEEKRK